MQALQPGGGSGDAAMAAADPDGGGALKPPITTITARVVASSAGAAGAKAAPPPPTAAAAAFSTASSTAAPAVDAIDEDDVNAVTSPQVAAPTSAAAAAAAAPPPPLFFAQASAPRAGPGAQIAIGGHRGMGMNVLLAAAAAAAAGGPASSSSPAAAAAAAAFDFAATSAAAGSAAPAVAAATAAGSAPTAPAAAAAAASALPPTASAGAFFISPAWRENTVSSMRAAAAAGASFVEFDVQVTRDGHAVLWHDDAVEYGDPAAPQRAAVGDLTLAEFRALGSLTASGAGERLSVVRAFWTHEASGGSGSSGSASDSDGAGGSVRGASPPPPLARAAVLGAAAAAATAAAAASSPSGTTTRALATAANAAAAPANSGDSSGSAVGAAPPRFKSPHRRWRCRHEEPFPALEEVFRALPPEVAFNIEVKMATPSSLARTPPKEIERVVAPVLATVDRCIAEEGRQGSSAAAANAASSPRMVVFSSFDPDVCAALRARTSAHPVCLLSTGDTEPHADARRTSLAAAVQFASAAGLAGVVVDSTALWAAPGTVADARALGLAVMTYGGANGDPRWVAQQAALGVHAAIVDDVEGVLGGLVAVPAQEEQLLMMVEGEDEEEAGDAIMTAAVVA